MLFQKRVKAGLLLYALLMLSIFLLLLQFYLNRQVAQARNNQSSSSALVAYGMAHWTKEKVDAGKQSQAMTKNSEDEEIEERSDDSDLLTEVDEINGKELDRSEKEGVSPPTQLEEVYEIRSSDVEQQPKKEMPEMGQVQFNEGHVDYYLKNNQLSTKVYLLDGRVFYYDFHINSANT